MTFRKFAAAGLFASVLFAASFAARPAVAQDGLYYELEIVTQAAPASEYAKLAELGHDLCNQTRKLANLPPKAFPSIPNPFVLERLWTLSNGKDYVLRKREFRLEPAGHDPEDCGMQLAWSETTVITRGGKTTHVTVASNGFNEVAPDQFTSPWNLERNLGTYPDAQGLAGGLQIRCARPGRDAPDIQLPLLRATRLCIASRPAVFRDQFGESLLVEYDGNAEFFEGRGGQYQVTSRVQRFGTRIPNEATWNPATYLRD